MPADTRNAKRGVSASERGGRGEWQRLWPRRSAHLLHCAVIDRRADVEPERILDAAKSLVPVCLGLVSDVAAAIDHPDVSEVAHVADIWVEFLAHFGRYWLVV